MSNNIYIKDKEAAEARLYQKKSKNPIVLSCTFIYGTIKNFMAVELQRILFFNHEQVKLNYAQEHVL